MAALFSDDEPNITREVMMSCVGHSLGYIDWRILSQQFERYNVMGHDFFFYNLEERCYFKYDFRGVQFLVEELRQIENGLQIFYNCLRDTQDICHGHRILADDLELEAGSEISLCVWLHKGIPSNQSPCSLAQPDVPGKGNVWSLLPAFRG